jgi:hypothetical protein
MTTNGSEPQRNPRADADAAVNAFDATRMHRERGISEVAASHTTGPASDAAIGAAFIQGNGEAAHQWTRTPGKQNATPINGSGSGFPGLANEGYSDIPGLPNKSRNR